MRSNPLRHLAGLCIRSRAVAFGLLVFFLVAPRSLAWSVKATQPGVGFAPPADNTVLLWQWRIRPGAGENIRDFHVRLGTSTATVAEIEADLIATDENDLPQGWTRSITKVGNEVFINWFAGGGGETLDGNERGEFALLAKNSRFKTGSVQYFATTDGDAIHNNDSVPGDGQPGQLPAPTGHVPKGPVLISAGLGCELPDDSCTFTDPAVCSALSGTPSTGCNEGACCTPVCVQTFDGDCDELQVFHGEGVACASVTCQAGLVPTVSEWGIVLITLSLLAAGTLILRPRCNSRF